MLSFIVYLTGTNLFSREENNLAKRENYFNEVSFLLVKEKNVIQNWNPALCI